MPSNARLRARLREMFRVSSALSNRDRERATATVVNLIVRGQTQVRSSVDRSTSKR
jgi:hypothetical protein